MCGAKPVRQIGKAIGRGVTAVYTAGVSEVLRNNLPRKNVFNQVLMSPERTAANIGEGVDKIGHAAFPEAYPYENPPTPDTPELPPDETGGPTPQFMSPNPTESAALRRRRRLQSMRAGLASTILTGTRGDTSNPSLLQTGATGSNAGGKTKLGQ